MTSWESYSSPIVFLHCKVSQVMLENPSKEMTPFVLGLNASHLYGLCFP